MLYGTLLNCTRIITTKKITPEYFLKLIETYNITKIFNTPYPLFDVIQCKDIENTDLSSLKLLVIGGTKVPYELIKKN